MKWTWEHWLLLAVAAIACGWLGYTDRILDLQEAERQRQENCHAVMNGLGMVPAPFTAECYGVKPEPKKDPAQ